LKTWLFQISNPSGGSRKWKAKGVNGPVFIYNGGMTEYLVGKSRECSSAKLKRELLSPMPFRRYKGLKDKICILPKNEVFIRFIDSLKLRPQFDNLSVGLLFERI